MYKSIIKSDAHSEDIKLLLQNLFESNFIPKGVIHVGAHLGEELPEYLQVGFNKVIFIEANPNLCKQMEEKFAAFDNVKVFNCAIADKSQKVNFYVYASNTTLEASSLLRMNVFDKIVKSLKLKETIEVDCWTLEDFVRVHHINLQDYNLLLTDIQGADYLALQGAKNILKYFDAVICEVQEIPLYDSYVPKKYIFDFLEENGLETTFGVFHQLYNVNEKFTAWGEVISIKKHLIRT
jgi:FkbM family methyltransferase